MRVHILTFTVLLMGLSATKASGQTYTCHPASASVTTNLKNYVTQVVTGNSDWNQVRQKLQLPTATSQNVSVVTQTKACKDAAIAYNIAVHGPSAPAVSRQVVIIKVGSTRYVVLDPTEAAGEYQLFVIFDSGFHALASYHG